jgi:chloramphenicol 3-O-phosphotransferase
MSNVVIVSGSPASGKTTLCSALAASRDDGVHLVSDAFYEFIPHRVDPTTPESWHQNSVIMQALASSALAYAQGGYAVYLDGVIGPWFLPVFRPLLESAVATHYIVLSVSEAKARARARRRQGEGLSPVVAAMQPSFMELGPLSRHAVDVEDRSKDEILAEVCAGLESGAFALDWSKVEA